MVKISRFNKYYKINEQTTLVFNSWSTGLAIVDDKFEALLSSIKNNVPYSDLSEELKDTFADAYNGHFIVDDDCDEIKEYYHNRDIIKYSTNKLSLTIAPTLACNFRCPYCYEEVKTGVMSTEMQSKLADYVKDNSGKIKNLDITWYGGEPLLSMDVIKTLSSHFIEICKENNVAYQASMVTNGYLLNDEYVDKLIECKIDTLQITIDGPKAIHDKRRICVNGQGSYDTIIYNLNNLLKKGGFNISVRVNVDKTNIAEVEDLLKDLNQKLINKDFNLYLAPVGNYNNVCKSIESQCFNEEEYAKEFISNYRLLEKYGFAKIETLYPRLRFLNCGAERLASFVIDPNGYMYKCWDEVGLKEKAVASLSDKYLQMNSWKNLSSIDRKFASKEKCENCYVLPLCGGGCSHKEKLTNDNTAQCDDIRLTLDYRISEYYKKCNS